MIRPLHFFRVLDDQSNLSITNISIIGLLVKVLAEPNPPPSDIACLTLAVANYLGKKILGHFQSKIQAPSYDLASMNAAIATLQREVDTQKSKISSLSINASIRPPMKPLGR